MGLVAGAIILICVFAFVVVGRIARRKNVDRIVVATLKRRRENPTDTQHIFFCLADHYEPMWHGAPRATALDRVRAWHDRYPRVVDNCRDNGGRTPRHSFFYPAEEYDAECIDLLSDLCRRGYGDVEVHLHHDGDTSSQLREKLVSFRDTLRRDHGLLHDLEPGTPGYAFIHGNWTLNDSGDDGRHCGVRDELIVLRETGCYADFTYPSAPHPTQPPVINRIYYAKNDPSRRASHHRGVDARYGGETDGDLLLFTGPLSLNWHRRRRGFLPAVENGDITHLNPVTPDRVDQWVQAGISVRGWPNWIFVKAYTHGAQEGNSGYLLSDTGAAVYRDLLARYNDGQRYVVHFSTPWEFFCCVRALESADSHAINQIEAFSYPF